MSGREIADLVAAFSDILTVLRDTAHAQPSPAPPDSPVRRQRDPPAHGHRLVVFPSNALTDPTIEDRRDAHPATLRRAVAFIDENAHTNLTPADIAAACFVTIRTLQLAFRRHLDTTPPTTCAASGSTTPTVTASPATPRTSPSPQSPTGGASPAPAGSLLTTGTPTASSPATPCASEARGPCGMPLMRTRSLSASGIQVMAVTGERQ